MATYIKIEMTTDEDVETAIQDILVFLPTHFKIARLKSERTVTFPMLKDSK